MGKQLCMICGEERSEGQTWFLVAASHWEDKLQVLRWQDELANRKGIYSACCPAHVQELVTHWMASGNVDFLLYCNNPLDEQQPGNGSRLPMISEPDTRGCPLIGELAVDRESLGRVLNENPDSLLIILDELRDALERETADGSARLESGAGLSQRMIRQI